MNLFMFTYIVACVFMVFFMIYIIEGLLPGTKYSKKFLPVKAKVVAVETDVKLKVLVSYRVNNEYYETLLNTTMPSMKTKDYITIHYNPDNPTQITSIEAEKYLRKVYIIGGILMTLIGCILFYFVWFWYFVEFRFSGWGIDISDL